LYDILLKNVTNTHEYEELIKIFLRPGEYRISSEDDGSSHDFIFNGNDDKNITKEDIYDTLSRLTGMKPPWGIVTGIRPVKMTGEIMESLGSFEKTRERLTGYYRINEEKADKAIMMYDYQQRTAGKPPQDSASIYIGIPFCPTRCLYCSFASNQKDMDEIRRYLDALHKEIDFVGAAMRREGLHAETLYIGGGTPTTPETADLNRLLVHAAEEFAGPDLKEFTLEAGRPDTITEEKMACALEAGVDRISINPQTMKDATLELIGRQHDSKEVRKAFAVARKAGIPVVNADVIAGLPGETVFDFAETLKELMALGPENITVHTLAVKRASRLAGIDKDYHYRMADTVAEMLDHAGQEMYEAGYTPYYLYRQKHMAGAQENTGYARPGTECIYNVRIMDEHQTVIAMGAGGISKVYYADENRLERVPNVSNYEIYIERLDEMIERKRQNIFTCKEGSTC